MLIGIYGSFEEKRQSAGDLDLVVVRTDGHEDPFWRLLDTLHHWSDATGMAVDVKLSVVAEGMNVGLYHAPNAAGWFPTETFAGQDFFHFLREISIGELQALLDEYRMCVS